MTPLAQDALIWTSIGGMLATGSSALFYRRRAATFKGQAVSASHRASDTARILAARDEEAVHLAGSRLPALVYALQHGTGDASCDGGPLHLHSAVTAAERAYLSVLHQVHVMSTDASERGEAAARAAVEAAVRSLTALVLEQQQKITLALDNEHDERLLELLQPLDHTASQLLRRLQILGAMVGMPPGRQRGDTQLLEVVRGGVSRIGDYTRVRVGHAPALCVGGRFVEAVVLAVAELLDNATRHSAPTTPVEVTFVEAHHGVALEIHDGGLGMTPEVRAEAVRLMSGEHGVRLTDLGAKAKLGLRGIGALSRRVPIQVTFDEGHSIYGGVRAVLYLPRDLLVAPSAAPSPEHTTPTAAVPNTPPPGGHAQEYPVSTDGLPVRTRRHSRVPGVAGHAARPATQIPPPDSGGALAAFVRGIQPAHKPTTEEPTP
ncbi:ATP-binding protein [Streptomyces griseoviridis]|uniref:ATP-binding protein n=1 Tax=Streptomyces griseoviridis TaxID=45398 RepID=UPI00344C2FFE